MSLASFQRALADLAGSPDFCKRVRAEGDAALAGYDLTDLERRRLVAAAAQRGMAVNCMLYRSNRLSPLVSQLPYTFHLLAADLRPTAESYWAGHPRFERNAPAEVRRFAAHVQRRVHEGCVAEPLVAEVLAWEIATYELALLPPAETLRAAEEAAARARADGPLRPHPMVAVTAFTREPRGLLQALFARARPPFTDVEHGAYDLLVDLRGERRAFTPLDAPTAQALRTLSAGGSVHADVAAPLIERGLAIAA